VFALAQSRWSPQDIYLFVAAFGAMGHHLPGMIRAYGDRALFERFRWRFILAPLFLLVTCVAFYCGPQRNHPGCFFLGVWHGMMQTYGFCRILRCEKPARSLASIVGSTSGFVQSGLQAAVVLSPMRMTDTLDAF